MSLFTKGKRERICFVHVPKCGGQSIKSGLEKGLNSRLQTIRMKAAPSLKASLVDENQDLHSYREQLLRYFLSDPDVGLVMGHYPCRGKTLEAFKEDWKFVTILRNPVERFISHYLYNKHKKSDHFKQELSLDEYLGSEQAMALGELYIRYFSDYPKTGDLDQGVEEAITNLKSFASVGILENLESWMASFQKQFDVRLSIGRKNINPAKSKKNEDIITHQQMEMITKLCDPSIKIYNYFLAHER